MQDRFTSYIVSLQRQWDDISSGRISCIWKIRLCLFEDDGQALRSVVNWSRTEVKYISKILSKFLITRSSRRRFKQFHSNQCNVSTLQAPKKYFFLKYATLFIFVEDSVPRRFVSISVQVKRYHISQFTLQWRLHFHWESLFTAIYESKLNSLVSWERLDEECAHFFWTRIDVFTTSTKIMTLCWKYFGHSITRNLADGIV